MASRSSGWGLKIGRARAFQGASLGALGLALAALLAGPGCSSASQPAEATSATRQPIVGGLPDPNIAAANTSVNRYTPLAADAATGATTITVGNAATLNAAPGDLLFIVQMQGAQVNGTNTNAFGAVTLVNGAGQFEMVTVQSVTGNQIALSPGCGLVNAYSAAAHTQVIWVPQYSSLTVAAGGSVAPPAWDGAVGGVVVVQAGAVNLTGAIDASGLGFRGGVLSNLAFEPVTLGFQYRSPDPRAGGEKGEGIAGFEADYDAIGGRYSLGAIANGGGGGAAHNGGGGGGANGDSAMPWLGSGVMPAGGTMAAPWSLAWALDPDAIDAGGPTQSSGGGRGGYSYSAAAQDPLTVGPGQAVWMGDFRQYRGGLGGRPLANDPLAHAFAGGGGGAGNENDGAGGPGGAGGGIIYIVANSVTGTGAIRANGAAGGPTTGGGNDGPGGGGGGGTIVVVAPSVASTVVLQANGGAGGDQHIVGFGDEAEGPGGGGGGGFIAAPAGATATTPTGGRAGATDSPALVAFPPNGATNGAPGQLATLASTARPPMCIATDLAVALSDGGGTVTPGTSVTYTLVVTNHGPNPATGAVVSDPFGPAFTGATWTCAGAACPGPSGMGNLSATLGALAAGQSVTFTLVGAVSPTATGTLSNTATVSAPGGITDGTPGNNSVTVTNPLLGSAALTVGLAHAPAAVVARSTYTYTLTVSNAGPSAGAGITATVTAPAGATLGTTTAPGWTCSAPIGQTVTCTLATLASGASTTITQSASAPPIAGTATASASVVATVGGSHTAQDTLTVLCGSSADCPAVDWCTGAGACLLKTPNGQPVPNVGPASGVCNMTSVIACASGACDPNGNVCGIQPGDGTCTTSAQCINDLPCTGAGTCQSPIDAGAADGGSDGAADAGNASDAAPGADASASDAGPNADASPGADASSNADASAVVDAGPDADASTGLDASPGVDASPAFDGGAASDASDAEASDASPDAGLDATTDGGEADANLDASADAADAADAGEASLDASEAADGADGAADAAGPLGGLLEGGGCSCKAAGTGQGANLPGSAWALTALLGLAVTRRRRDNGRL